MNVILFKSSFMLQLVCAGALHQIAVAKYSWLDEANGSCQLLHPTRWMLALFHLKASFLVKSPRSSMKSHCRHRTHAEKIKFHSFFQVGFSALMKLHKMMIEQQTGGAFPYEIYIQKFSQCTHIYAFMLVPMYHTHMTYTSTLVC